jgi:DNA-directed RNA polymerase subunit RPC12/RpoP
MLPAYTGDALVYYVCGGCGISKMEVEPPATRTSDQPLRQTGLVCVRCNQPYAVIEHEGPQRFEMVCRRCGHQWTVPTTEPKKPDAAPPFRPPSAREPED